MVQLYETTLVRHGIMVVGPAGSGKSKIISSLQDSLTHTTVIPSISIQPDLDMESECDGVLPLLIY